MATKKRTGRAKKVLRRVGRTVAAVALERFVSPDTVARARELFGKAQAEPHGTTALTLRVEALELVVAELVEKLKV